MSIQIICVVANAGICRENTYVVRDYCKQHSLSFATRIFEPVLYEVDNKLIGSLPGFHVYKGGVYQRTFGLGDDIDSVLGKPSEVSAWCAWLNGFCWRCVEKTKHNKL